MLLLGLSVVKNEADIIEAMVRLNLRFLDHLHIIDNGSVDGTLQILTALSAEFAQLTVAQDPAIGHQQTQLMNRFIVTDGQKYDPDHILPLDADEILAGDPAAFRHECSQTRDPIAIAWQTYVPTGSDNAAEHNPVIRIRHRRAAEMPQYHKSTLPRRLTGRAIIGPGSHKIMFNNKIVASKVSETITMAHYPIRDKDQIIAKAMIGTWGLNLRGAPPREGQHWRQISKQIVATGTLSDATFYDIAATYAGQEQAPLVEDPQSWPSDLSLKYQHFASTTAQGRIIAFTENLVATIANRDRRPPESTAPMPNRLLKTDILPPDSALVRFTHRGRIVEFCVTHPKDVIQSHHLKGSFYELEELAIIEKHFTAGSHFIDIGSNVGNHAVFCGLFLKPARIMVAEPNPVAIRTLRANIALNGLDQICDSSRVGVGLGAQSTQGASISWRSQNWDRFNLGGAQLRLEGGDLDILTGDAFLAGALADFIKIDVEGMELQVLAGLRQTIARHRPKLFIEVDEQNYGGMDQWLADNDYRIAERFSRYPNNCNYLCLPDAVQT